MITATTFILGAYLVQAYVTKPGDKYPEFHPLRAFEHQGDAMLFKQFVNSGLVDYWPYLKTYKNGYIVTEMTTSRNPNFTVRLKMKRL